jgi:uncharacterized protein YbaA (DUF1428 family)
MAQYVDAFVVPVPKNQLAAYRTLARRFGKVWIEHRALAVHECAADDVKPGKRTSFPQAVKLKDDEFVVFSWIVFKSRAHRDAMNARVMTDARVVAMEGRPIPFDGKRMFWGGFKEIVSLP